MFAYRDYSARLKHFDQVRVKPAKERGKVLLEVGFKDPTFLRAKSLLRIQKILVPTDFSETSRKALEYALAFARQFHAKVFILNVVEIPYGMGEAAIISNGLIDRMHQDAKQRLATLLAQTNAKRVPVQTLLRSGPPYHEIVQAAKERRVDLIVISTKGHTGLVHLFLGSTAERVVRHAPCPVLVVRDKEHEFITGKLAQPGARSRKAKKTSQQPILAPIDAL